MVFLYESPKGNTTNLYKNPDEKQQKKLEKTQKGVNRKILQNYNRNNRHTNINKINLF